VSNGFIEVTGGHDTLSGSLVAPMLMHQRSVGSGAVKLYGQIGDDDGDELVMIIENMPFVRNESDNMCITENL